MPVAASRRRAHGDEDGLHARHRCREIGGEGKPPGLDILHHQRIESGLENRHFAAFQHRDLVRIAVDADHVMPEIGKTHA